MEKTGEAGRNVCPLTCDRVDSRWDLGGRLVGEGGESNSKL